MYIPICTVHNYEQYFSGLTFVVSVSYINVFIVARRSALLRSANLRKINRANPAQNNDNNNRIQLEAAEDDEDDNDDSSDSCEHAVQARRPRQSFKPRWLTKKQRNNDANTTVSYQAAKMSIIQTGVTAIDANNPAIPNSDAQAKLNVRAAQGANGGVKDNNKLAAAEPSAETGSVLGGDKTKQEMEKFERTRRNRSLKKQWQIAISLFLVTFVFIACYIPSAILDLNAWGLKISPPESSAGQQILFGLFWFSVPANPLIYAFTSPRFREDTKMVMNRLKSCRMCSSESM